MGTIKRHSAGSETLNVLIHGMTASTKDWITPGDYTKGGDLARLLEERGHSWLACDLYGHGDWVADEPDFDTEAVSDDEWVPFISRSAEGFRDAVKTALSEQTYAALNLVSYSMGSLVAIEMVKQGLPLPVSRIVMAVPATEREYDDETSLHNNLEAFSSSDVSIALGRHDEEVAPDDIRWFFDQIPGDRKVLRSYDSGHSLPLDWVTDVIDELTE